MDYVFHILVLVGVYVTLTVSLDLVVGHTGFLSIGHAAFYGIGAYTSALLAVHAGTPYIVGVVSGMLLAAVLSFAVSLPALRLHGDYFVIATFALQMILFNIFNNWTDLAGGAMGIPGIPYPVLLGWHVDSNVEFIVLVTAIAAMAYLVVWRITTSPFGRVLHAIREDEVVARAMGKNTLRFRATAFAVSAALAASAGSLYAHYIMYLDPTSFTVMESILIISMVIVGGAGSSWGPLIGAFVLVTLPEGLRFIGLPSAVAANLRQILYGALLVVMMMFRPRGLVGTYAFGRCREMDTISCDRLYKSFDGICAVADLTLELPETGVVAIIGPNGAGKTTLLNLLTGFLRPDSGRCRLGGLEITRLAPHRIARLGVGRTFQDLRLIEQVSGLENVMPARPNQRGEGLLAALSHFGVAKEEAANREEAMRLLRFVGLADKAAELAGELSYGEQKLLTIACCLATEARILFFDEPVTGVHPEIAGQILDLLSRITDNGKLVVFIEHDISAVRRVADLVIVMDDGRVITQGPPSEVLERPEILEAYVG